MKYVYELKHSHITGKFKKENLYDIKTIGFYSSLKLALETLEKYKEIEGFRDYPDGFYIEKIQIDFDDYDFL